MGTIFYNLTLCKYNSGLRFLLLWFFYKTLQPCQLDWDNKGWNSVLEIPCDVHLLEKLMLFKCVKSHWMMITANLQPDMKSLSAFAQYILSPKGVQFSSVAQLCPTLCDPMDCSTPGLPVHHQLLELAQTHVHWVADAIQPSHPLSSYPSLRW